MRIARELGLPAEDLSHLFYALLLKDAGCSSNSARVFQLFGGDDQAAKRAAWMRDWRKLREQIALRPRLRRAERPPAGAGAADGRARGQGAVEPPDAVRGALRSRRGHRAHARLLAGDGAGDPLHGRALGRRRLPRRPAARRHPAARPDRRARAGGRHLCDGRRAVARAIGRAPAAGQLVRSGGRRRLRLDCRRDGAVGGVRLAVDRGDGQRGGARRQRDSRRRAAAGRHRGRVRVGDRREVAVHVSPLGAGRRFRRRDRRTSGSTSRRSSGCAARRCCTTSAS